MTCQADRDGLLDVLYGEADPGTTRQVEEHLSTCPECREELASLRRLRSDLARWELPGSLRAGRAARGLPRGGRLWRPLAAAAAVLLALGGALGVSGSELRYEEGRVAFRLGRAAAAPVPASLEDIVTRLSALENRQQETARTLRASAGGTTAAQGDVLRRLEQLVRDVESRQALLLEARLEEYADRAERQRRYDLAQVSAGLSYLDGKTGLQVARTTELVGHVLQASQKK